MTLEKVVGNDRLVEKEPKTNIVQAKNIKMKNLVHWTLKILQEVKTSSICGLHGLKYAIMLGKLSILPLAPVRSILEPKVKKRSKAMYE